MRKTAYKIADKFVAERLDKYVAAESGLSRAYVQKLIKAGLLVVNSVVEKANYKIKYGDHIEVTIPEETPSILIPEDIPIEILWEDEHIIAVNKPPQMVVYPAAGHKGGTLLNALISRCEKLASIGGALRPGIVHRLDKDTSGVMVVAKSDIAYINLTRQFRERAVEKHYTALLYGNLSKDSGVIKTTIGRSLSDRKKMTARVRKGMNRSGSYKGKEAITEFNVLKRFGFATLTAVKIITGRTHQIRVHFAASGHPVLGDKTYGKKTAVKLRHKTVSFNRQMLHAHSIKFKHPVTGQPIELTAPIPGDMEKAVEDIVQTVQNSSN